MAKPTEPAPEPALTRRERQIMDILYTLKKASGQDIQQRLPGQPSYSTVRTILRVLERKGYVTHTERDLRYIYSPTASHAAASRSAVERLLRTFFEGSAKQAVAAFLDPRTARLTRSDLDEISALIEKAKKEAR